jgi:sugar/nucleoside kinase (ribokinase family)
LGYPVSARILSRDAANISCVVSGRSGLRVRVVTQTGDQAYTEFDTETSHQSQVYGPGIHEPGQIPRGITVPGTVVAVWIPAPREVLATNAEPGHGGTYVTVTVSGAANVALAMARAITRVTFAARPGQS